MKSFLSIAFLLIAQTISAQTPSAKHSPPLKEGTPASAGMSADRLERINGMLQDAVKQQQIPGAVALIARKGVIVFHREYGVADPESGRTFKKDDIFRIASQTKAITSTAVMMLWEEGKFQLDDPIEMYITEFKDAVILDSLIEADSSFTSHPADKPISIRNLITHTSGIGYGMIDGDPRFTKIYQKAGIIDAFTTEDVRIGDNVKKLARLPLHSNPGEKWIYSEGLDVLGYFVELMSGMPLDQFFQERIFTPLDMHDTRFYLPPSTADRLVPVLTKKDGTWTKFPANDIYDPDFPVTGAKAFFSGGGGLTSTARDYATFLQMYLNGGELNGMRLLSRTTVNFMMQNQIGDLWEGSGAYYGLAFGVLDQGGEARGGKGRKGTFEWGGYFNTQYFADPEEKVIGILMKQTQDIPDEPTAWKFRQMVETTIDD